ncbi:MAG: hypothetical protein AAF439_00205 [Pseudomonadota bacterium]
MTVKDRITYACVMALVIFILGQFVFAAGSLMVNLLFALAMGAFAYLAVTVATRIGGRNNRK